MLLKFSLFIFMTLLVHPVWTSGSETARRIGPSKSLRDDVRVPRCSLRCLEQFITTNYPPSVCSDPQDVECLCTRRSASNYTLGEAALRCVFSACPSPGNLEFQAYGICFDVNGFLPNTHSQLTITEMATSASNPNPNPGPTLASTSAGRTSRIIPSASTSTVNPASRSSIFPSSSRLASSPSITSPTSTSTTSISLISTFTPSTEISSSRTSTTHEDDILPTPTSTSAATTKTTTAAESTSGTPTPSASPAASSGSLSSGQLIGIYVGAGAALVSVVGFFLFCFFRKRRRDRFQKLKNPDFEIGGSMRQPTPAGPPSDRPLNPIPHTPIGAYNTLSMGGVVPKPSITQQEYERASSSSSRDNSSAASRAESQLLPDNPSSYRGVDATRPNIIRTRPDNSASLIAGYPENQPTVRDVANRQRTQISRQSPLYQEGTTRKSLSPQMYGLPAHPKISWSPKPGPQRHPDYAQPYTPYMRREPYENPYWTTFDGTSLHPAKSLRVSSDAMAPPPLRPLSNNPDGHLTPMRGSGSNLNNHRRSQSARYSAASSNTSFDSSGSKEAEMTRALQAHTPTRLSPVREVISRGSPSRSPVRNAPQSVPAFPPRSERRSRVDPRDLVPPLFSPSIGPPRQNSLLAKRRGTTVANRMEDQFTVHPHPNANPPRRSLRRMSPFVTPPSSTTNNHHNNMETASSHRPSYPDYSPFQTQSPFKYDYDYDYEHVGDEKGCLSPKGRRVTPTKKGPDMYLRID